MTIHDLQKKYNLTKDDFWEVRKGTWVVTHNACEKIAEIEQIVFTEPRFHQALNSICFLGSAKKGEKIIWATGEASEINVKGQGKYYFSMAEKRLKDRLTLKIINAYEYGIYSDVEAEAFKKKETKEKPINFFDYKDLSDAEINQFIVNNKDHSQLDEVIQYRDKRQKDGIKF